MGLIIPFLGVLAVSIGIAFLFGGEKGPNALGRAVRRGAAGRADLDRDLYGGRPEGSGAACRCWPSASGC